MITQRRLEKQIPLMSKKAIAQRRRRALHQRNMCSFRRPGADVRKFPIDSRKYKIPYSQRVKIWQHFIKFSSNLRKKCLRAERF
jgi:hypothetical protein